MFPYIRNHMKKRFILSVGAAAFFVVFLSFPQIYLPTIYKVLIETRFPRARVPGLYVTPTTHDVIRDLPPRKMFDFYGVKFGIPWTQATENPANSGNVGFKAVAAGQQHSIGVLDPEYDTDFLRIFLAQQSSTSKEQLSPFIAKDEVSSEYYFYRTILATDPDDLKLTSSMQIAIRYATLSLLKAIINGVLKMQKGDHIYSFSTSKIQGFQLGDAHQSSSVTVHLFDQNGTNHREMIFEGSQQELDSLLSSIELNQQ